MSYFNRNSIVLLVVLFISTSLSLGQSVKADHLEKVKEESKEILNDNKAKANEAKAELIDGKDEAKAKLLDDKDEAKAKLIDGKKTSKLKLNKKLKGKIKGIKRWITLTKIV